MRGVGEHVLLQTPLPPTPVIPFDPNQLIPLIGMMDITPIVAWFLLGLIEGALIRL